MFGQLGDQPSEPLVTNCARRTGDPRPPCQRGRRQGRGDLRQRVLPVYDDVADVDVNLAVAHRRRHGGGKAIGVVNEGNICRSGLDAVQRAVGIVLGDANVEVRKFAEQLTQCGCHESADRGRERYDVHRPLRETARDRAGGFGASLHGLEHLGRRVDDGATGRRQHDAATGGRHHTHSELVFESLDLLRHCRRSESEFLGGSGECAERGHGTKRVECRYVDHEERLRITDQKTSLDLSNRTSHTGIMTPEELFGTNLVAMVTPMHSDGTLDADSLEGLVEHLVDSGCDGIVVAGTAGEAPTLTDDEMSWLIDAVATRAGGRARVIAGVGTYDTAASVARARRAAEAGADALLLVTPYYSRPTQAGVVAHCTAVADATELPVMLYDVPERTGTAMDIDTLLELSRHERIRAVKDAAGDLHQAMSVMSRSSLAYYCGVDELNLAYLAIGATGLVSVVGNLVARSNADLIAAVHSGDLVGARSIHTSLLTLIEAIMRTSQGAIMAKAALVASGIISDATVRSPLLQSPPEHLRRLTAALS